MKGNPKVIDALIQALRSEITGINQYFVHAEMCANWGFKKLYQAIRANSIGEMKHAETLLERIFFLEGMPVMDPFQIKIGKTVPEQLKNDLKLEKDAVKQYNESIKLCVQVGDNGSRDLFLVLLKDEEEHVDWLEMQLDLIEQMGLPNYLTTQVNP
ncbi:MAG: bacterioferritin [Deltaproteobacteria bacterium]|nr:bacterioferritin [Deltaproteobacteria bacterium]